MEKLFRLLRDGLIIVLVTGVLLLAVELGLRWVYGAPGKVQQQIAYAFHPDYLIALKPGMEKRYIRSPQNGGDTIYWRTNAAGFRGKELLHDPELRVMVYGDSNIQGEFSALDSSYAGKLESYLQAALQREVEVINAGIIGFGPDQSLIRMTGEVARYRPDVVIFHVFADNDFGDLIRNRLFEIDSAGALLATPHPREADPVLATGTASPFMLVEAAKRVGRKLLAARPAVHAEIFVERTRQRCQDEYAIYREDLPKSYSHFADHYDFDLALEPDLPSSQEKVRLMGGVLKAVQYLAHKQGFRLLVLIQPSAIDVSENNYIAHFSLKKHAAYEPARLSDCVASLCDGAGISYLNLYPIFLKNEPNTLFFLIDDHWNDRGQDLAARETVRVLLPDLTGEAAR